LFVIPSRIDGDGPRNCNAGLLAPYSAEDMSDPRFAEAR
jgi:hypothetical protein